MSTDIIIPTQKILIIKFRIIINLDNYLTEKWLYFKFY